MNASQEMTEVVIYTEHFRISGYISLVPGARLTDYIREMGHFIAVANAIVANRHGAELFRAGFLDVGKDHIEIIMPVGEIHPAESAQS